MGRLSGVFNVPFLLEESAWVTVNWGVLPLLRFYLKKPGMMKFTLNPRTAGAEAGRSLSARLARATQ